MKKLIQSDNNELVKYLENNKEAYKQYLLNRTLINFKYIPKEYRKSIYHFIKSIL